MLTLPASDPSLADSIDVDALPDVTDRDYAIDLYQGTALGSVRIVGMGGAAVATAQGSAGTNVNPASPAVRDATSNGKWDWDWHLDWLNPALGSDFDNNGIETDEAGPFPLVTFGLTIQYKKWGFALGATKVSSSTSPTPEETVKTEAEVVRFTLARNFATDFTVGLGLRAGSLKISADNAALFKIIGTGLEVGGVWHPSSINLRLGVTSALPISGKDVENDNCDPLACAGYILPNEVAVPWRLSTGIAWRFAKSKWNQSINKQFRDEKSVTVAADVVITGAVGNGHSVEAFGLRKLQRSGRRTVVSVRAGAEYELLPGRLRLRGGSYWEPRRVSQVSGRLHGTAGLEVRLYTFRFWGSTYRLRASLTGDFAKKYFNTGASLGFWN